MSSLNSPLTARLEKLSYSLFGTEEWNILTYQYLHLRSGLNLLLLRNLSQPVIFDVVNNCFVEVRHRTVARIAKKYWRSCGRVVSGKNLIIRSSPCTWAIKDLTVSSVTFGGTYNVGTLLKRTSSFVPLSTSLINPHVMN